MRTHKGMEPVEMNKSRQSISYEPINNQQRLVDDIADLQSTVAYLELTIDNLNAVVTKQDKQLQDMQRQLQLMFARLSSGEQNDTAPFDVASEVPPHY